MAIFIGGLSFLMCSCSNENPWDNTTSRGAGKLILQLSSSTALESEMPDVRGVSTQILPPDAKDFQIRMTNASGTFEKTWSSVEEFEKETEFMADTYTLEGFYGSQTSQGIVSPEDQTHRHAYFYGKAENVKVEPGKETNVQIQTTLGNAVVVIEYTDAFKNYFKDWSTQLITKGEAPLNLGSDEGMCYVVPGDVDVVISAMQQNGKKVSVNPAIFNAEARHLYKITYNIFNGEVGHAETLQLIFNDQPDAEHTIEIELSDELLSGEGPTIVTEGFSSGDTLVTVAGTPYTGDVRFNIDSPDGFKEVILTITSKNYKPDFLVDGIIDLCSAEIAQQQAMTETGIRVVGIYNNPERMALIDLKELCRYLPEGEHTISVMVKDRARVQNASVSINALPLSIEAEPFKNAVLGRGYAEIVLSYNGPDPTVPDSNPFTFNVQNEYGFIPANIMSISKLADTRSVESQDYIYRIAVPETSWDEYGVKVFLNNSINSIDETTVPIEFPDYDVLYDPMARKVMMKLDKVNDPEINTASVKDMFTKRMRVFIDGVEAGNLNRNIWPEVILADGLEGGETFRIKTSLSSIATPVAYSQEKTLNFEGENQIPNGNFSQTEETINSNRINVGGLYKVKVFMFTNDYQNYSSIVRREATNWASINAKTCYLSSVNRNTWYVEPSSYVEDQIYTVRTVGYNHDGPALATTGGDFNLNYYCESTPDKSWLVRESGELFLGTYNFTGVNEQRSEGHEFFTRPSAFSFKYSYMPIEDEKAYVSIKIKGADGKILASSEKELNGTASYQFDESTLTEPAETVTLILPHYPFNEKAETIEVKFLSSTASDPDIYIPTGSNLSEGVTVITSDSNRTSKANAYHAYAKGSVLRISDLNLNYE